VGPETCWVSDGWVPDAVRGIRAVRAGWGTLLLILGVPDTVVDAIMGWEPGQSARMRRRHQHLTDRVLQNTAAKVGGLLWTGADQRPPAA
jgi:hypothetical protein